MLVHRSSFIVHRFLVVTALLPSAMSAAAESPHHVWLVSTRGRPHCGELESPQKNFRYWRTDQHSRWSPADAESFSATDDPAEPTVVFIHGNRTGADDAVTKAWYTYELLRVEAAGRPFRYVIWSWPAERMIRPNRADVRLKAAYSDAESYYLAQWLDRLRPGVPVSLIGHSFGPRIITGALHLLAGGEVAGRKMPESTLSAWREGNRNPIRAVLLAAAIDADWLAPTGCHGLALSVADEVLITRNARDRVLRHYPRVDRRGGPQAMGSVGPCGAEHAENLTVLDVGGTVGRIHDWRNYCSALSLYGLWPHYAFLE